MLYALTDPTRAPSGNFWSAFLGGTAKRLLYFFTTIKQGGAKVREQKFASPVLSNFCGEVRVSRFLDASKLMSVLQFHSTQSQKIRQLIAFLPNWAR
ncbi:MAG: hypothetical protein NW220_19590 [Leptolyngbyaceae cyanobacterium bins.349]|nr:hypothetical protein [Leptolyngbyaceae cyanobacterium bins.349]